jgi:hypothetical protein
MALLSPFEKQICQEESSLLKQATQFKKENQWTLAIECLRKAYALAETHQFGKTVTSLSRLPSYIEASGDLRGAWIEYHNVANLKYCSWYKSKPHLVYGVKADAYTRLAGMLFSKGHREQALAYAMAGYVASRAADWDYRKFQKDHRLPMDRWNLTGGLQDEIDYFMPGSSQSDKNTIKEIVVRAMIDLTNANPDAVKNEMYQILGCADPDFTHD